MSCRKHGYPWPSLATSPYRSSLLAGFQGYIPYPHAAAVWMFELVVLLLPGHMWGYIEVHHLWARPCFSSSVLHVSLIYIYIYIYIEIGRSRKRFVFFNSFILFLHTCYICICFQLVAFVGEHIWPKALLMGYSMRLELTLVRCLNVLQLVMSFT